MAAKQRNHLVDNIKALLIYLVVVGHLATLGAKSCDIWWGAWVFIYAFHMPAFFFVSGIFAKSNEDKNSRGTLNSAILFVFAVVLVSIVEGLLGYKSLFSFTNPPFACWFLLALCIMRLILPFAKHIKFIMPISIVLAIISGISLNLGTIMSLARVIYFLPFFLAGYFMGLDGILDLRRKITGWKKAGVVVLALALIALLIVIFNNTSIPSSVLKVKASFADAGISNIEGCAIRIYAMLTASAAIFALLVALPEKETKVTYIGRNCLSVYLVHTVVIILLREVTFPMSAFALGWLNLVLAAVIVLVLATPVFHKPITLASGKLTELLWRPFDKRA